MKLKLDGLKSVPLVELGAGTFFLVSHDAREPIVPHVVIDGGRLAGGKLALALSGAHAFNARRIRDPDSRALKLDVTDIAVELPQGGASSVASDFTGVLTIGENGPATRIRWNEGSGDVFSYVGFLEWSMDDNHRPGDSFFTRWKLIARLCGEEVVLGKSGEDF